MEYRLLGCSGLWVAPLCLGTLNFGDPTPEEEARRMLQVAYDHGINLFDTADIYVRGESERIIGQAIKDGLLPRERVFLATKFAMASGEHPNDRGGSRAYILREVESSLRRLQTDYIDLYQMHRVSFDLPIDETLRTLDDLVSQGKVRYIGSSTFPAWKVMEALAVSEKRNYVRFISEQPPYNLLDRRIENELVPLALQYHLALLPWASLGMGILTGRYNAGHGFPPDSRAGLRGGIFAERVSSQSLGVAARLAELAKSNGLTAGQLALLWVKDQPAVTAPIIGPKSVAQLEEFLPVLEMKLGGDLQAALNELNPPGTAVANFHNNSGWMKTKIG